MPVQPTYPGVYLQEVSNGVHTITGVATSITAFVGGAQRGPTNVPITIFGFPDFERNFGGLWYISPMSYAVQQFYLNGGSQAIIVRVPAAGAAKAQIDLGNGVVLEAIGEGEWANSGHLRALIDQNGIQDTTKGFNLKVNYRTSLDASDVGVTERFLNLSVDPSSPRYVKEVLAEVTGESNFVTALTVPETLTAAAKPADAKPADAKHAPAATTDPFANGISASGGKEGGSVAQPGVIANTDIASAELEAANQGMYALAGVDLFNLLCIPPRRFEDDGFIDDPTIDLATAFCQKRRAFFIMDPPPTWTSPTNVLKADGSIKTTITLTNYGAVFFPRVMMADPLSENRLTDFVPCGVIAGIFATTDAQRGVWKAPAGVDAKLVGVARLATPINDDQNGLLNQKGVNCLRSFPAAGRVVWGARTLNGNDQLADEYKYIPVRRLALFLEESLYRGLQWAVFEPNDEPLWAQIRLNVGAFMQTLFRQGAFQGRTPREAYLVKCDSQTTTQNDINQGIVNVVVGFAPLKPAEFVFITIEQLAGQIQV